MIALDSQVTTIDLGEGDDNWQVASASVVSDTDGSRQATLLFPPNTTASMILPDGSTQSLSRPAEIRGTEYTVGDNGPSAMPGELPSASGYTYAIELSVDEALEAGATSVEFNQPVPFYVNNFIGFPVGEDVPLGYYDRSQAAWIPSDDGRVIKILGITGGYADLNVDDDPEADIGDELTVLGITDGERQQLASLYPANTQLWRVLIPHFTPWDLNWSYGVPEDAIAPSLPEPQTEGEEIPNACETEGSIISCESQTLSEVIEIGGTPFKLYYNSARTPGHLAPYAVNIPIVTDNLQQLQDAQIKGVQVEMEVGGQKHTLSVPEEDLQSNQAVNIEWDGTNGYGQQMLGKQRATIKVGYVYPAQYYSTPQEALQSFALFGDTPITGNRERLEVTLWQESILPIGNFSVVDQGMGGWRLNVHHTFDPSEETIFFGHGTPQQMLGTGYSYNHRFTIDTVAGSGSPSGNLGDGGVAIEAALYLPMDVASGPDGSFYIADFGHHRIRRVLPDQTIMTVAGKGEFGYAGDEGPATDATLSWPESVAVASDGSIIIADTKNDRIRQVGTNGYITTIAGGGDILDRMTIINQQPPATAVKLCDPTKVAYGPDGSFYIVDNQLHRIYRVSPSGQLSLVAGASEATNCGAISSQYNGDGILAIDAHLNYPSDVAVGSEGIYIIDRSNRRIRLVDSEGFISTVAGNGELSPIYHNGSLATQVAFPNPLGLAVAPDESLVITTQTHQVIKVDTDGIVTILAGQMDQSGFSGDGGLAINAKFYRPVGLTVMDNNVIYVADSLNFRIRKLVPLESDFDTADFIVPSDDGRMLYEFDSTGRHLFTRDALTLVPIYTFGYQNRLLSKITDRTGREIALRIPLGDSH